MIALGTLTGLHEHQHQLAAYRTHCDRRAEIPLGELVADGHGSRRLPAVVLCRVCAELVRLQVRPPVRTRSPGGWTTPP